MATETLKHMVALDGKDRHTRQFYGKHGTLLNCCKLNQNVYGNADRYFLESRLESRLIKNSRRCHPMQKRISTRQITTLPAEFSIHFRMLPSRYPCGKSTSRGGVRNLNFEYCVIQAQIHMIFTKNYPKTPYS
ncbi:MAG: hypothetical protein FWF77_06295 [Defluviitaleaceae bacterium]|nr:hypothetical protein [Defluviitaleaceae bacterium]